MRDETHKHYAKRLLMIGMSLLPVRFVGMAYNSGRSSIHRITNELSAQLGTVTARVDAARDGDRKPEAVDTVSTDIEGVLCCRKPGSRGQHATLFRRSIRLPLRPLHPPRLWAE